MRILIVLILICIIGAAFYFYNTDDNTGANLKSGLSNLQQSITSTFEQVKGAESNEVKIYKHKDQDGNIEFSNTPPASSNDVESKVYRTDANILPAPKTNALDEQNSD